jgi:hypothetical protein
LDFQPKSLLLFTTPQNVETVGRQLDTLKENFASQLQVVAASLDSNLENSISELWIDEYIKINDFTPYEEKPSRKGQLNNSQLSINFNKAVIASLNISNSTRFYSDLPSFMLFHDKGLLKESGQNLSSLSITLPIKINSHPKNHFSNLIPLQAQSATDLIITKVESNLILGLNNESPPKILMKLLKNFGVDNVVVTVFAKITNLSTNNSNIFEIVAGGGEWGNAASTLVLKDFDLHRMGSQPETSQYKVEFFIVDPHNAPVFEPIGAGVWVESVDDDRLSALNSAPDKEGSVFPDALILGSIDGVKVEGQNYNSPSELVGFDIEGTN